MTTTTTGATTIVATVASDVPQGTLEVAVRRALAEVGATLIPCGWAPDPDTIADAVGVAYVDMAVLDLNP